MRRNDYSTEGIKDKKDEVRDVERWLKGRTVERDRGQRRHEDDEACGDGSDPGADLVAAVPAFAASAVGGSVQYVDCGQPQVAVTQQLNAANNQRLAGMAQDLSVELNQVLVCSHGIAAGRSVW